MTGTDAAPRPRSGVAAALLSLIAPSAGHVYAGHGSRGVALIAALFAVQVVLRLAGVFVVPPRCVPVLVLANVLALLAIAIYVFGIIDAARLARRPGPRPRRFTIVAAVPVSWLCLVILALLPRLALPYQPWRTFSVPSASMQPTLQVGEWFIADTWHYRSHAPARGDLAVYHVPGDPDTVYVKRIVGLPGDRVEFRGGRALVNGAATDEPMIEIGDPNGFFNNTAPVTVPAGHVFVVGDNRANSMDSRAPRHGPVPVENLLGRGTEIFWGATTARMGLWIGTAR